MYCSLLCFIINICEVTIAFFNPLAYNIGASNTLVYDKRPLKGVDTVSASAQNYVYMVKSRTEKPIETKPTITRKELEEMRREVNKYLVQPIERKN